MYALVVEDLGRNLRKKRRADAGEANKREVKRKLHVLSWGHPKALLKWCAEYWDGESIWPLLPDDQSHILSVESDWDMKDSDIIAFAYTPIPTSAAYLFPKATTSGKANKDIIIANSSILELRRAVASRGVDSAETL